jgi:hypothetical protein
MEIKRLVEYFYANIDLQQVWEKLKRQSTLPGRFVAGQKID